MTLMLICFDPEDVSIMSHQNVGTVYHAAECHNPEDQNVDLNLEYQICFVMKTNLTHFLSIIYFIIQPLHVLGWSSPLELSHLDLTSSQLT
jgi:hypothetical protein